MWYQDYQHIHFKDKGRALTLKEARGGVDCWGLVRLVYHLQRGILLPSYDECYSDTKDGDAITPHILTVKEQHWHDVTDPLPFDLIILKVKGLPWHVGMVVKPGKMLHCGEGFGTVFEDYPSKRWPTHNIVGFVRYGARKEA